MGKQLLRSSTSVAANYRAACRARSRPEFASRIGVVVEESDESAFWLELLSEAGIVPAEKLGNLRDEANGLTAIFTATRQSVRNNKA